ncbi:MULTISPECIES: hypothetical protein [Anaerolinea]|jgi:hypothetical protein|uniref:hypothetical protein n=1 Tax=Anaerolinea TaxID=233189 RepID=UPI002617F671|nr:hypothetical protein [Anaerolinea thermophila]
MNEKTQSQAFVNEALPELFHRNPDTFVRLLERDGTRLLRFYWDEAGKRVGSTGLRDSFGLNYLTYQPNRRTTIYLITLPEPKSFGEAYFVALVYRPYRVLILSSDVSGVYSLERIPSEKGGEDTLLVEWTKRLHRIEIRKGVLPEKGAFLQAVWNELGE